MYTNLLVKNESSEYTQIVIVEKVMNNDSFQQEVFNTCIFLRSSFYDAQLSKTIFKDCVFYECLFSDSQVYQTKFINCYFSRCNFTKWDIISTEFNSCNFDTCNFKTADFTSAILNNVKIYNSLEVPVLLEQYVTIPPIGLAPY